MFLFLISYIKTFILTRYVFLSFLQDEYYFFFFLAFAIQLLVVVVQGNDDSEFGLTIAAIPIIVVILIASGYWVRRENKIGMAFVLVCI